MCPGDVGQTGWSISTLQHVEESGYDVLLFAGDLAYADYYQPLWDSFGQLVSPVASARPWMVTQGNHDVEVIPLLSKAFKSYNSRWSMPYKESGSTSNLYYSFEVAGVHVLMLGSYTDYSIKSEQYAWLQVSTSSGCLASEPLHHVLAAFACDAQLFVVLDDPGGPCKSG